MSIDQLPGTPEQERPARAAAMISGHEVRVASNYLLSADQECPHCAHIDPPHLVVHFGGPRGGRAELALPSLPACVAGPLGQRRR